MKGPVRPSLPFRAVNQPGLPGYNPGLQRHHVLPRQLATTPALAAMMDSLGVDVGIDDFRRNGLLLPATDSEAERMALPLHRGPHREYSDLVLERVGQVERRWARARRRNPELATREALMRMDCIQRALRRRLLDPARWEGPALHRNDPTRARRERALDYADLDAMAVLLWQETAVAAE
ncbi:AHH domain-containing protein [Novosphingobium huizhouense]|uniref:AHH domain-containing protein n=1 Tax=Novosphingobium huizhouense TaxID=2866625 RepID=UPI001CD8A33C|nr:AHH domain-containing protein [Novosphingobium huizhouense]